MRARAVHQLTYGRIEVLSFEHPWRSERYVPNDPKGTPVVERSMATGPTDLSTRHNSSTYGEGAGYDPACLCCWLGICHTADKHRANVGGKR